ncbi:MAG: NADH:flavin oxidoreductase [Myxococcales bacterium]|nr:NADH:flavin oxidoreductase [Myxococcales bacterium]
MWQPPERIKHALPVMNWPSAEEAASSMLFSPIQVGPQSLSSRTWIPAMVPWRATSESMFTDDVIDWYARLAKGRPGAIVVEATGIRDVPSGPLMRAGQERFVPGLRRLPRAVKDASEGETKLFIQLIDFLQIRRRPPTEKFFSPFLHIRPEHREALAAQTEETGFETCDEAALRDHLATLSPEELASVLDERELDALLKGYRERVWDTHLDHIRELPQTLPGLFANAARHVLDAGFDGVELHYARAYAVASFLSALNNRADDYGGSPENRVRLPLEVLAEVRKVMPPDKLLGLRFLGDEVIEEGDRLDDAVFYAQKFAESGVDFLSVSKGREFEDAKVPKVGEAVYPFTGPSGYECMPSVYSDADGPFGRNVGLATAIKHTSSKAGHDVPVVTAGGIGTFEMAEGILQRGEADIICAARQCIADPDWFLKARLGKGESVRPCEYTNYCEGLDLKHKQVTCKLWDRKGLDEEGLPLDHSGRRRLTAPSWTP